MDWILIRADASQKIGSGHIMRCLTLAGQFTQFGLAVVFVCRHLPDSLEQQILAKAHKLVRLPPEGGDQPSSEQGQYGEWLGVTQSCDAQQTLQSVQALVEADGPPKTVLCDHYALDETWETEIGQAYKAPIAVIDDLSNRVHACHWLIDVTFGRTESDYQGLVPKDCFLFTGSRYALLRPKFSERRDATLTARDAAFEAERPVKNLLIAMGGADKDNVTAVILEAVAAMDELPRFHTHVLVGGIYPHIDALKLQADRFPFPITVHHGVENVDELYAQADVCIGAAGSSAWERCCLGLPTINIVIAENQKTIAKRLSAHGATIDGGYFKDIVPVNFARQTLQLLINDGLQRRALSLASREVCDGRGAGLIAQRLIYETVKHGEFVTLRDADTEDFRLVYDWECRPETRRFANNPDTPIWEDHVAWMNAKLNNPDSAFYIIMHGMNAVGVVRLDQALKSSSDAKVISIFIASEFFGHGIASAALKLVAKLNMRTPILAEVHPENTASIALFRKNDYQSIEDRWYRLPARV